MQPSHPTTPQTLRPPFWCDVCSLDLQSRKALSEHKTGRKHRNRAFQQDLGPPGSRTEPTVISSLSRRSGRFAHFIQLPAFDGGCVPEPDGPLAELFDNMAVGKYRNIVIVTGAGISTAAGVRDFRSKGGIFETLCRDFGDRFPEARHNPEWLLSRSFAQRYPDIWEQVMLPRIQADYSDLEPTSTHCFCAWLHRKGWLRRIYTQNVDGLHLHPTLGIPTQVVVECHGSMRDGSLVLYGDDLPKRFSDCCDKDFPVNASLQHVVDLVLVFGTSLQVAPFCAVPNMAPRGSTRVLVNNRIDDCLQNDFNSRMSNEYMYHGGRANISTTRIGSHKKVPQRSLWTDRKANKKWNQLLVESDCDDFVQHFFDSDMARRNGHSLSAIK